MVNMDFGSREQYRVTLKSQKEKWLKKDKAHFYKASPPLQLISKILNKDNEHKK